jgi:hypothetical protein
VFSNQYWWVDILRIVTITQFTLALLFIPVINDRPFAPQYKNFSPYRTDPAAGREWLSLGLSLLLITAITRTIQFFGQPMIWSRTPFLLGAGFAFNIFLIIQWKTRRSVRAAIEKERNGDT